MDTAQFDRARHIKLLLMDCDGVLTDGKIYFLPGPDGQWVETKIFDTQDGLAFQWLHRVGIKTGVISGRKSHAVEIRAESAHMDFCYQGHLEKIPMIEEIKQKSGLQAHEIAFVGDDFTDVVIFNRVGWSIAVANARPEVKASAHYTTQTPGGQGAIREVVEILLKSQGLWDQFLNHYEIPEAARNAV